MCLLFWASWVVNLREAEHRKAALSHCSEARAGKLTLQYITVIGDWAACGGAAETMPALIENPDALAAAVQQVRALSLCAHRFAPRTLNAVDARR